MNATRRPVEYLVHAAVVALALSWFAPEAWLVFLTDGLLVAAMVVAAAGWGAWPAAWLVLTPEPPARPVPEPHAHPGPAIRGRRLCTAMALGLGVLAIATLVLGVAGWLNRVSAWALVAGGLGLAVAYAIRATQTPARMEAGPDDASASGGRGGDGKAYVPSTPEPSSLLLRIVLTLPLALPLTIGLLAVCVPPGVLWEGEAGGYDVLEYHLQAPREYFQAGRIHFLPHNVYASFPQQMEMLYLLQMYLLGDAHAAAIPAQMLHLTCGMLAVLALGCWMPTGWPRITALLLAGSSPWLMYVGALAYVENGMLFFATVAAGLLHELACEKVPAANGTPPPPTGTGMGQTCVSPAAGGTGLRRALAAGACLGLAGACKYTAMAMVTAGLPLAYLLVSGRAWRQRSAQLPLLVLGATLTAGPWLARNATFTGNPVYPFAFGLFDGKGWSASQAEQWARGHTLPPTESGPLARVRIALRELFGDLSLNPPSLRPAYFGPILVVLGIVAATRWKHPEVRLPAVWAGIILLVWAGATHMPGRFAVCLLIPLSMLAGNLVVSDPRPGGARRAGRTRSPPSGNRPRSVGLPIFQVAIACLALGGSLWNGETILRLWLEHDRGIQQRTGGQARLTDMLGMTDSLRDAHLLNQATPPWAYVWIVGDAAVFYVTRRMHYTVVFNRDPWLEFAAGSADPASCVDWLRTQGVTHVLFSWGEIERLRRTYGFNPVVTREWAKRLTSAGLRRTEVDLLARPAAGVELYEVTPAGEP